MTTVTFFLIRKADDVRPFFTYMCSFCGDLLDVNILHVGRFMHVFGDHGLLNHPVTTKSGVAVEWDSPTGDIIDILDVLNP